MSDSEHIGAPLAELAARKGVTVPCAGNLPVWLDDPAFVWFVETGSVNVFLVEIQDGNERSTRQHLMSRDAGCLMPGVAPDDGESESESQFSVLAKGKPGTILRRLPVDALPGSDACELAAEINSWVIAFTDTLARFVGNVPRPTVLAESGATTDLAPGTLAVRRGVVWVSDLPFGTSLYMDILDDAELAGSGGGRQFHIPLTRTSWLGVFAPAAVEFRSTESLMREGLLEVALAGFHRLAFAMEHLNRRLALVDEANLERVRTASRRSVERVARRRLFNIYDLPVDAGTDAEDTSLVDALKSIGQKEGLEFKAPKRTGPSQSPPGLTDILDASGIRARDVVLRPEDRWWRTEAGALLAFYEQDNQPVALLPGMFGGYRIVDPRRGRVQPMNASRAGQLKKNAWMFYRPLPPERAGPADLFRIALHGASQDLARLVLAGLPAGFIKLAPALGLGFVAGHVAADGAPDGLYALAVALGAAGLAAALLHMFQDKAMMRLEWRAFARAEAAFWDRVLRLPQSELPRRSVSDLAMSSMTFQKIREGAQGVVAESAQSVVFLLPVLAVTLFYDVALGLTALAFSLVSLFVSVILGIRQVAPHVKVINSARGVTARLFQIIGGIVKLRVESAEGSAYAVWAREYRAQKQAEIELGRLQSHSRAFAASLPFLAAGALLAVIAADGSRTVPAADFLVVFTVFLTFQSTVARFSESFGEIAAALPAFRQLNPVLAAMPERVEDGEPVEYLGGNVLFDRVFFKYDSDGPLILDDVTIRANPGEFVAIAGESGAGKSTLFRLAIGLDRPTSGAVLYDGRDLVNLNLKQVRRLVGSVPQSIRLQPQDIWDNIALHSDSKSAEQVWEAARTAGIERQIKAMPMGMMTLVGSSGSVLSGGESQRISIARALLGNPRVLLLDEATNWLDNVGQAEFMQNLEMLTSTRIVIAHRLSTLVKADRIYVLQGGKVVQSGGFEELSSVDGVFKELIQRQLA